MKKFNEFMTDVARLVAIICLIVVLVGCAWWVARQAFSEPMGEITGCGDGYVCLDNNGEKPIYVLLSHEPCAGCVEMPPGRTGRIEWLRDSVIVPEKEEGG